jgi:oligopeptide/dipeptide ABC transporter ATP-binding protein
MPRQIGDVILEVEDLHTYCFTRFGTVKAVDGVSFNLRQGESLAIVGESGCGKTMTALSLLKLQPKPAARIVKGSIKLEGEDLVPKTEEEMREIRGRRISMILQDPQTSLNPVFTVGNQLIEAIKIHHKGEKKQGLISRAVHGLKQVRVAAPERRVEDYPHQISGGMKQRVVGAIAISCEPKIIIADEPTTSLDVTIQAQYLRLLRELQEATNLSLIFITHDFGVVAKMADRVMVMYAGRPVETGTVRQIFNNPKHPYTQALLRSVPRMEVDVDRLYSITGQPPALWDLPEGCRFAPRCEFAMERCRREYPSSFTVKEDGPEHVASCWLLDAAAAHGAKGSDQRSPEEGPQTVAIDRQADGAGRRVGGSFG